MTIERVSAQSAARLAELHARCFETCWDEREFASLISMPSTIAFADNADGVFRALVLVRIAADEAEILTIGVDPEFRGHGLGSGTLDTLKKRLQTAVPRVSFWR